MEQAGEMARGRTEQKEMAEKRGADLALLASAASVVLAWYQFYVQKNRSQGLFIGLWPPTILAFASYFNQTRMSNKLESSLGYGSSIGQLIR